MVHFLRHLLFDQLNFVDHGYKEVKRNQEYHQIPLLLQNIRLDSKNNRAQYDTVDELLCLYCLLRLRASELHCQTRIEWN